MTAKVMNSGSFCSEPAQPTPNEESARTTQTSSSVWRRPRKSDIQPTKARPVPLTSASRIADITATYSAKLLALANLTRKLMPKKETLDVQTRATHMIHICGVRYASAGVNCLTAGGFLVSVFRASLSAAHRTGSTEDGHQFLGGSLKNRPHPAISTIMYT